MPFQIIRNDITKVKADAIVNTANPRVCFGRGTDSAIYNAAGRDLLLAAREKIGEIAPGQAAATDAFALNARYIIHTVGPVWVDGNHGEREILASCYRNSMTLADELKCESIAFPLIASGTYGFPKDEALHIALSEIQRFLLGHEMNVLLVVFDRKALELSESLVGGIEQYIDDHTARSLSMRERLRDWLSGPFRDKERKEAPSFHAPDLDDFDLSEERLPEPTEEKSAPLGSSRPTWYRNDRFEDAEIQYEKITYPSPGAAPLPKESDEQTDGFFREDASFSSVIESGAEEIEEEPGYSSPKAPAASQKEPALPKRPESSGKENSYSQKAEDLWPAGSGPAFTPGKSLDDVLKGAGKSFQERLLDLIDESGMTDVTVYKKANIDRKVFSRIRCKPDYKPKKKTAVAFAIALELDLPTMIDLLSRAEIALSPHSTFDLIICYFVTHRIYDIFEINATLFKYGQPILGE